MEQNRTVVVIDVQLVPNELTDDAPVGPNVGFAVVVGGSQDVLGGSVVPGTDVLRHAPQTLWFGCGRLHRFPPGESDGGFLVFHVLVLGLLLGLDFLVAPGPSEVAELDLAQLVHQDVLWRKVPVYQAG